MQWGLISINLTHQLSFSLLPPPPPPPPCMCVRLWAYLWVKSSPVFRSLVKLLDEIAWVSYQESEKQHQYKNKVFLKKHTGACTLNLSNNTGHYSMKNTFWQYPAKVKQDSWTKDTHRESYAHTQIYAHTHIHTHTHIRIQKNKSYYVKTQQISWLTCIQSSAQLKWWCQCICWHTVLSCSCHKYISLNIHCCLVHTINIIQITILLTHNVVLFMP